jgi:hypothetical protein
VSTYIQSEAIDFFVPAEHDAAALAALREADINAGDHTTVAAVLRSVGYDVESNEHGTALIHFNGLSRHNVESVALAALAPFVSEGSAVVWSYGAGDPWRQVVKDGQLVTQHVSWVDDDPPPRGEPPKTGPAVAFPPVGMSASELIGWISDNFGDGEEITLTHLQGLLAP